MKKEELAQLLDGREYGEEITPELEKEAKESGLVVVFGRSDDLMEFRGAEHDEVGAWAGQAVFIGQNGLMANYCDEQEQCPNYHPEEGHAIMAEWCPSDATGAVIASWVYETEIPHSTFDIMEEGELYCRGIVFSMNDLVSNTEPPPSPITEEEAKVTITSTKEKQLIGAGIIQIQKEREEQVRKHGNSLDSDVANNGDGQLAEGARMLLMEEPPEKPPKHWSETRWNHMRSKPYKNRLVIAGALVAAELDRLDFMVMIAELPKEEE